MIKQKMAEQIAAELLVVKGAETVSKNQRVQLEEELVMAIKRQFPANQPKIEGSVTYDLDNNFKVVVTGKLKRTLKPDVYDKKLAAIIPEGFDPVYETTLLLGTIPEDLLIDIENNLDPRDVTRTLVLDEKALRDLATHHADVFAKLATAGLFETKPQKTAVTVTQK